MAVFRCEHSPAQCKERVVYRKPPTIPGPVPASVSSTPCLDPGGLSRTHTDLGLVCLTLLFCQAPPPPSPALTCLYPRPHHR